MTAHTPTQLDRSAGAGCDGSRMMRTVRTLADLGGRAIGSRGEQHARDYIHEQLSECPVQVSRQKILVSPVPTRVAVPMMSLVAAILFVVAGVLYEVHASWSLAPLTMLVTGTALSARWYLWVQPLFDRGTPLESYNVVGTAGRDDDSAPHVIFVAHYDSKSQALSVVLRVVLTIITLCMALLMTIAVVVTLLPGGVSVTTDGFWLACMIGAVAMLGQALNRSGNRSPGAVDNASGVATVLELARVLPKRIGNRAKLTFLFSAGEEIGMAGVLRFVQRNNPYLDEGRVVFVNIDGVGTCKRITVTGGARGPGWRSDGRACHVLARECAGLMGLPYSHLAYMVGAGVDHIPPFVAGYAALTVSQTNLISGMRIHTAGDIADQLDEQYLAMAGQFVCSFAESVVSETSEDGVTDG